VTITYIIVTKHAAMTNAFHSRDVINLTLSHLRVEEIPPFCLVSLTWAETARPLIIALLHERIASLYCSQKLLVEASLGAVINFSLLANGKGLLATTSARSGDGKLRAYNAAAWAACPDAASTAATVATTHARGAILMLPDDQEVIGAVQLPAGGASSGVVLGLAVGEGLGYGAALHSWAATEAPTAAADGGRGGGEFGHLTSLPLEHSSTLSGPEPMVDGGEPCLFKCRATHTVRLSNGVDALRCIVHNSVLASQKRSLVAAWDAATGKFLPGASADLSWDAAPGTYEAENQPPGLAQRALDSGRYGGIDCAFAAPPSVATQPGSTQLLATGHARGADGVCRVRLWEVPAPEPAGAPRRATQICELVGPTLPTKAFSVAGVQALSLGGGWVAAACADGRVHLWRTGDAAGSSSPVAVLGSQGVLAACRASAATMAEGLSSAELPPDTNPRAAAAETCSALCVDPSGKFLLCAFAVTLKRSAASFASGRKKEVRVRAAGDPFG